MYGLGMVLSGSYLTLLLVRFGTEGLLKAGISSRFHAKHPTKYSACWKSGAKIRKIFGICKFFDAKKEEKWKKMGKMKKAELSLLSSGFTSWMGRRVMVLLLFAGSDNPHKVVCHLLSFTQPMFLNGHDLLSLMGTIFNFACKITQKNWYTQINGGKSEKF